MALKDVVDSLDEVDESDRKHYVAADGDDEEYKGKFVLDANFEGHPVAKGLRGIKKQFGAIADEMKAAGVKPGEIKIKMVELGKLQKQIEKLERAAATGDHTDTVKLEKLQAQLEKEKDEAVAEVTKDRDTWKSKYQSRDMRDTLREAAKSGGVLESELDDVIKLVMADGRFRFEDEKIVNVENGEVTTITPKKFFKDVYVKEREKYYKPRDSSGANSRGSDRHSSDDEGDDKPGNPISKIERGLRKRAGAA